jgi:hypothetical protein
LGRFVSLLFGWLLLFGGFAVTVDELDQVIEELPIALSNLLPLQQQLHLSNQILSKPAIRFSEGFSKVVFVLQFKLFLALTALIHNRLHPLDILLEPAILRPDPLHSFHLLVSGLQPLADVLLLLLQIGSLTAVEFALLACKFLLHLQSLYLLPQPLDVAL